MQEAEHIKERLFEYGMSRSRKTSSTSTKITLIRYYKEKSSRQLRTHFICLHCRMQKILQRMSTIRYRNLAVSKTVCPWTLTQSLMSPTMKYLFRQRQLSQLLLIQVFIQIAINHHKSPLVAALHQTFSRLLKR
jgi:hypothetical protein